MGGGEVARYIGKMERPSHKAAIISGILLPAEDSRESGPAGPAAVQGIRGDRQDRLAFLTGWNQKRLHLDTLLLKEHQ